jgi:HEAT repeat protein
VRRLETVGSFEDLVEVSGQPIDSRVRIAALRALVTTFGERARAIVLEVVRDGEDTAKVRAAAARLLGRTGPEALTPLDLVLSSDLPDRVRAGAARGLGEMGTTGAAHRLLRVAAETTTPVRDAALVALSRMSSRSAAPVLTQLVLDPALPNDLRVAACDGLGGSKLAEAVTPLATVLGSPETEAEVRAAAARALGRMGRLAAIPAVVAAEADPSSRVADQARIARIALSHRR